MFTISDPQVLKEGKYLNSSTVLLNALFNIKPLELEYNFWPTVYTVPNTLMCQITQTKLPYHLSVNVLYIINWMSGTVSLVNLVILIL